MSTPTATLNASLPDVSTFLSDLSSTLQGRSLADLPHVTFPSGTFLLVAVPVNVSPTTKQKVAIKQDESSTGTGKSRRSQRHLDTATPGPTETSARTDGNVQQGLSQPSRHQEDEGKAYSMLCDIIDGYSASNLDQR